MTGGDRNPATDDEQYSECHRGLAAGLAKGHQGRHLMTFHLRAVHNSAELFHNETWLDFKLWQTSTRIHLDYCRLLLADCNRTPVKPNAEDEARHEHSHRYFSHHPPHGVRMMPKRVRQVVYYAMLCDAFGDAYGCRDVWRFHVPSDQAPDREWARIGVGRCAFRPPSRCAIFERCSSDNPWHKLVPDEDNSLVVYGGEDVHTGHPASLHIQGAMAEDSSHALVCLPDDMPVWADLNRLAGNTDR